MGAVLAGKASVDEEAAGETSVVEASVDEAADEAADEAWGVNISGAEVKRCGGSVIRHTFIPSISVWPR